MTPAAGTATMSERSKAAADSALLITSMLASGRRRGLLVDAAQHGVVADGDDLFPGRLHGRVRDAADHQCVATDLDAEFLEQQLGERAGGNARRGLAGAGAFEDVAQVVRVVLQA